MADASLGALAVAMVVGGVGLHLWRKRA
jgi:hypothetical protein